MTTRAASAWGGGGVTGQHWANHRLWTVGGQGPRSLPAAPSSEAPPPGAFSMHCRQVTNSKRGNAGKTTVASPILFAVRHN